MFAHNHSIVQFYNVHSWATKPIGKQCRTHRQKTKYLSNNLSGQHRHTPSIWSWLPSGPVSTDRPNAVSLRRKGYEAWILKSKKIYGKIPRRETLLKNAFWLVCYRLQERFDTALLAGILFLKNKHRGSTYSRPFPFKQHGCLCFCTTIWTNKQQMYLKQNRSL